MYALRKSRKKRLRAGIEELRVMRAETTETAAFKLLDQISLLFMIAFPISHYCFPPAIHVFL